eukprot:6212958-Pleurochrysis_carterae.AAC.2
MGRPPSNARPPARPPIYCRPGSELHAPFRRLHPTPAYVPAHKVERKVPAPKWDARVERDVRLSEPARRHQREEYQHA